jgi:hypothetical protein
MKNFKSVRLLASGTILLAGICATAVAQKAPPAGSASIEETKAQAEIERTYAERDKLIAERDKLKMETENYKKNQTLTLLPSFIGLATIVITVLIATRQIAAQQTALRTQAAENSILQQNRSKVDALIKAAELAMDAPTTGMMRSRSKILSALLNDLVPDFGKKLGELDFEKYGFASHRDRFISLLQNIANNPENALLLTESYDILFPQDDKSTKGRINSLREFLKSHN